MLCAATKSLLKKIQTLYGERDEVLRAEFDRQLADLLPETPIVSVDEAGCNEDFHPQYGRAPIGKRVFGEVSGRRHAGVGVVSGLLGNNAISPLTYSGTMNSDLFEAWFDFCLCPILPPKTVIIMDNARFHRKSDLIVIAHNHGCRIIFLPPYSPDKNPIEHLWAKLKRWLRRNVTRFLNLHSAIFNFFQL